MRADRESQQVDPVAVHPTTERLLKLAERLDVSSASQQDRVIATWVRREAHLLQERYTYHLAAGCPAETAGFIAQDDMGLQIVMYLAEVLGAE